MTHKIGYACISQTSPYRTSRRFSLKDFSAERFIETTRLNLEDLLKLLQHNVENGIFMFRISSDLIPFASHPINTLAWWDIFKDEFEAIGHYIKAQHIRVSMHPGQYTVLNSPSMEVVERSIADLDYHARVLDAMTLDAQHKLILHVGGVYGDKGAAMARFKSVYLSLSNAVKNRLILENDDQSYTVEDVLSLCRELKIPMVLDNLHHELNPCDKPWSEIVSEAIATWHLTRPKFHYSDQDPWERKNGHSQTIHSDKFMNYMRTLEGIAVDVMLEVKDKDISTLKANLLCSKELSRAESADVFNRYYYRIMESGEGNEFALKQILAVSVYEAFIFIENCLRMDFDLKSFKKTADRVHQELREHMDAREEAHYQRIFNQTPFDPSAVKRHFKRLADKYGIESIRDSYYFEYQRYTKNV